MDMLDDVTAGEDGKKAEGNLWHWNGWSRVNGKEIGMDGNPIVTNGEVMGFGTDEVGDKVGYDRAVKLGHKRRALLTLVSAAMDR